MSKRGTAPRKHDPEFRKQAGRLVIDEGMSVSRTAADLGIASTTLDTWVRKFRDGTWSLDDCSTVSTSASTKQSPSRVKLPSSSQKKSDQATQMEIKNRELEAKLRRMTMASDILKKAMAYCLGWAMADNMETKLVIDALNMALIRQKPKSAAIFHSDRGSQYASYEFQGQLTAYGLVASMSRSGNCYDNAPMESFWHTLKTEFVHHEQFATRAEAKAKIFEWIEVFYNRARLHSSLGYKTPVDFAQEKMLDAA